MAPAQVHRTTPYYSAQLVAYTYLLTTLCYVVIIDSSTGKGASSGVGFAIPIDTVKGLVDQILQYGRVMRPSLGVVIAPPQALQRINQSGVLVLDVSDDRGWVNAHCWQ